MRELTPTSPRFEIERHWPLIILLSLFAGLALYYSTSLPLGEAADERHHFALIRFIAEMGRPPLTVSERQSLGPKGDASPVYHGLVTLLTQYVDVSDLPELPDAQDKPERFIPYDQRLSNQFLHTEDELFPYRGIVLAWHLARLPSIFMGVLTLAAIYLTVLLIYPKRVSFALAVTGLAAFIPRFITSSAVVNDDNLVFPLIAFSIYGLVLIVRGRRRRSTFVVLGVLMGLAAITKYHSLILVPEATLILIVVAWRNRWGWQPLLRRWGWSMLAFGIVSGWWFAFLFFQLNEVAERGWLRGLLAPLGDPVTTGGLVSFPTGVVGLGWLDWAALLFQTFWVEYGGMRVLAPSSVYWIIGLLSLLAISGLIRLGWAYVSSIEQTCQAVIDSHLPITVLAFHLLVYGIVVTGRYLSLPLVETAQGRHLYPALTSIAFFLVVGLRGVGLKLWPHPALDKFLLFGLSGSLLALSLLTPALIFLTAYPYLPITTHALADTQIPVRLEAEFAQGVNLVGFDVEPTAPIGRALPVTLYWQVRNKPDQDYLTQLCLHDDTGQAVTCRLGHPADGRYPMRAWEVGYVVRDEIFLPTPACLSPDDYQLTLAVLPLRRDRAATTPDNIVLEPLSLAQVSFAGETGVPVADVEIWAGERPFNQPELELQQIRQALTVITYETTNVDPAEAEPVKFTPAEVKSAHEAPWLPVAAGPAFACGNGSNATTYNFVLDQSIIPDRYHLYIHDQNRSRPQIVVKTRPRAFTPPSNIPLETNISFSGEVELLGYDLDLSPRWPGDKVALTAYWRAGRTMARNYVAILKLLDNDFVDWGAADPVMGGAYPTVLWAPGEVVVETYALPIDRQTPPGLYSIEFSVLYDFVAGVFYFLPALTPANTEAVEHFYVGPVRVLDPARTTTPSHPMSVTLGHQIELLGYDLAAEQVDPGRSYDITLYWQAINRPAKNYTVFVQLVGPDGRVYAQQDNQPQTGRYPTTAWVLRDRVVDRYRLHLDDELPPGQYRLLIGMYDLATTQRLPAIDESGSRFADDAILLTTFSPK